jgi:hypothetical protein
MACHLKYPTDYHAIGCIVFGDQDFQFAGYGVLARNMFSQIDYTIDLAWTGM